MTKISELPAGSDLTSVDFPGVQSGVTRKFSSALFDARFQLADADLTLIAAGNNGAVLAATTASFLVADENKLDNIEALADVTDATNVAAAGALMTDGSAAMAANLDMDGNNITNIGEIVGQTAVVNTTDAATVAVLDLYGRRANPANGDSITQSFYMRNDALEDVEAGRITWALADETDGTEDASWRIGVMVGGTLTDRFILSSGGAGPHLRPINNNTLHLGTGTFTYASLHLGSGAAINWNNGDVTITHSSNLLTLAGGNLALGTNNITSVGSVVANGPIGAGSFTVGTLPSASSAGAGARALVTDANATTFASTVAGSGANVVPVYSDGTNWRIG